MGLHSGSEAQHPGYFPLELCCHVNPAVVQKKGGLGKFKLPQHFEKNSDFCFLKNLRVFRFFFPNFNVFHGQLFRSSFSVPNFFYPPMEISAEKLELLKVAFLVVGIWDSRLFQGYLGEGES